MNSACCTLRCRIAGRPVISPVANPATTPSRVVPARGLLVPVTRPHLPETEIPAGVLLTPAILAADSPVVVTEPTSPVTVILVTACPSSPAVTTARVVSQVTDPVAKCRLPPAMMTCRDLATTSMKDHPPTVVDPTNCLQIPATVTWVMT